MQPLRINECAEGFFAVPKCTYTPDSKKNNLEEFTLKLIINNLTSSVLPKKVENHIYSEKSLFSLFGGIILFICQQMSILPKEFTYQLNNTPISYLTLHTKFYYF